MILRLLPITEEEHIKSEIRKEDFMANTIESEKKKDIPTKDGAVRIRATLNKMGFSDKSIGFNDVTGNVTLNGKDFMKPSYYDSDAGITYAPEAEIQKSVTSFYKDSRNPVVRVSDAYGSAAGKYGLGADALTYGNDTVSIGGVPLNTLYIDKEGKAWAWADDVNSLVEKYADTMGIENPDKLAQEYESDWMPVMEEIISGLKNRKEFSYDPNDDPVYKAYRAKYMQESDRASRDAMASYSALTGGYTNSAGVTAGALANQYYAKQISDVIPQLAEQAYQRYYDSYRGDMDLIDKILNVYDKTYDNAVAANNQLAENANYSAKAVTERDSEERAKEQERYERGWSEKFNQQKYDTQERENYWNEIFNPVDLANRILENDSIRHDNYQKSIYEEYYRSLLEGETEGVQLKNDKIKAETRKILLGY